MTERVFVCSCKLWLGRSI